MKISVALAAYKGEKYILQQLNSILMQLGPDDEVVISDDCPSSGLFSEIFEIISGDGRIKYIEGPAQGVIKNFENAIKNTTGDVIFLCDQDDVWLSDKVSTVVNEIKNGADLVLHDARVVDAQLNTLHDSFFAKNRSKKGLIRNIIKNSYMGCCMAMSSNLKEDILPFPPNIPMHDQWIGLVAQKRHQVKIIDKPLILYRMHSGNLTGGRTSLYSKIKWRLSIIFSIIRA